MQQVKLSGSPAGVHLQTSQGQSYSARSLDALFAKTTEFKLPINQLRYWIRGLPAPSSPTHPQFDKQGRIVAFTQQGWHINLREYMRSAGFDLPHKLELSSAHLRIKLIIYSWQLA